MPTLKARIGGAWVDVGGAGASEVEVSATDPIAANPAAEVWYDTADTGISLPNGPRGHIGSVYTTTWSAVIGANVWTDYAGMAVTWTADPSRRYKTTVAMLLTKLTNVGYAGVALFNGSTQIAGNLLSAVPIGGYLNVAITRIEFGISGVQTRQVKGWCDFASVQFQPNASYPAMMVVEDIGSV